MSPRETGPSRPRRGLRRAAWAAAIGTAALVLALAWLLGSAGGRDSVLAWLQSRLGEDALTWQSAEGRLGGTLVLHDLRWQGEGVAVSVHRLELRPRVRALLGGTLRLESVLADEVQVRLDETPEAAPEPWTAWPDFLPRLSLPGTLQADALALRGLAVTRGEEALFALDALEARDLRLAGEGVAVVALSARGDWGQTEVQGHYVPAEGFDTDLEGELQLTAPDARPDARLSWTLRGDAQTMDASLRGVAGGPVSLEGTLRDGLAQPRWTLSGQGRELAAHWFGPAPADPPLDLDVAMSGEGDRFGGELGFARNGQAWRLDGLQARFAGAGLAVDAGRLRSPVGALQVEGRWDPLDAQPLAGVVEADDLAWAPAEGGAPVRARGRLSIEGLPEAWQARLTATLRRGEGEATLALTGGGDTRQATLTSLSFETPGGALRGDGQVAWAPATALQLQARLDQVDPGYLLPDYPGALSGALRLDLRETDAGWGGSVALEALRGELRGRRVQADATLAFEGGAGDLSARAQLGESRLAANGRVGPMLDLAVSLAPLRLADVFDGAAGELQGTLGLAGPRAAPGVAADLRGSALRWGDLSADQLQLQGELPAGAGRGRLTLQAEALELAGRPIDQLGLVAEGRSQAFDAQLELRAGAARLAASGSVESLEPGYRGQLRALSLQAPRAPDLALQAPADWAWSTAGWQLAPACLAGEGGGRLCLQSERGQWQLEGEAIALAAAQPWLPDTGVPLALDGRVAIQATLAPTAAGWRGELAIDSAEGRMDTIASGEPRRLLAYRALSGRATLADGLIEARLEAGLNDAGRLEARLRAEPGAQGALDGEVSLAMRDLTWLELFSPDIVSPRGQLDGRLRLAGTRDAPRMEGELVLDALATELPALGLQLEGGRFTLANEGEDRVVLRGEVRSGDGVLRVDGSLDLGAEQPLALALTGQDVTLSDTPDLQLVASPALVIGLGGGRLRVGGRIDVPRARVDLEALDGGAVAPSPDVVVVDAEQPREDGPVLDLAVHVALGDDVQLRGFGLDGRLGGALDLRQAPGRAALATGTLEARGRYRAYGQDLDIRRARLSYVGSPVDNPGLDILAERRRGEVTVGVQVRGSARRPETRITSTPAMETSEALSWLVFGRPLRSTNASQSGQIEASALALGVGGNLLAQRIGDGLGLDSAGVEESRALGGATFTVGKYLSPRLFLGYGISLVGRGQVVTLKYLLAHGFDITIESGEESAASLNWRTER